MSPLMAGKQEVKDEATGSRKQHMREQVCVQSRNGQSCLTLVSEHGHHDGEQGAQDVEQRYGALQDPVVLTLGALAALLDA